MKRQLAHLLLLCFMNCMVYTAAYRKVSVDSPGGVDVAANMPAGSVAARLNEIELALLNGQYDRSLMLVRRVKPLTLGMMLPAAPGTTPPATPPANTPSAVTPPTTPPATTPPATTSDTPPATPPTTPPATPSAADTRPQPEAFSTARLDALKKEIDDSLALPFDSIDDVWARDKAGCVAQYKQHLDKTVAWVYKYSLYFEKSEWVPLANYFYEKIIDSMWGVTNPLKIRRGGKGIQGALYKDIYDLLSNDRDGFLKSMKDNLKVHQADITNLQKKIADAKIKFASS